MLTVLESIKLSTEFLEKKGIESPRLNAEILLSEILNCKRLDLYLKFDQPLKELEISKYREWIKRRGLYEPIQYIIGKIEFFGLQFRVNSSVLIPRPETEILVEEVIKYSKSKNGLKILDIGTGSGIIAIAIAKQLEDSQITAIDISQEAINLAIENAVTNEVISKLNFLMSDIKDFENNEKFDVVVSNPPYISKEDFPSLQNEIKDYEPRIALTDSNDGLDFYKIISKRSKSLLKKDGRIYFEVGKGQADNVKRILIENDFICIRSINDYQQIERVVTGVMQ
jgi:release factor glutamine methyltransferase